MALDDLRLSLLTFPQRWDGKGALTVNLVVIPVGDPFAPLTPTGPRFAGTELSLRAVVILSLESLPQTGLSALHFPAPTPLPANQLELFGTFLGAYAIDPQAIRRPLGPDVRVRKSLPPSYLAAVGKDASQNLNTTVGDEFGCSLIGQDPGTTRRGSPPPRTISWGALLSFSLRQPKLARELGLSYPIRLDVGADTLKDGGFIYVEINPNAANAPYAADALSVPPRVRSYAARVPALARAARPLFAAVLFPLVPATEDPQKYDDADLEAQTFDDGFASVVHCDQPLTFDAASGDHGTLAPATDAGLQIGWDDEQVTTWHNRQLDIARARQSATDPDVEIPLGVLGYRVDVSDDDGAHWASLCLATQQLNFGALQGPQPFEAAIEPAPVRANRPDDNHAWLPRYFAQWRGGSLVADDPVVHEMTGGGLKAPPSSLRALPPQVSLRYGQRYKIRVRLADLSGGGPSLEEAPAHPGAASVADWDFQRHVPPKALRVATTPTRPPMPPRPTAPGQAVTIAPSQPITSLEILRPLIGYPEMRFAGLGDADLMRFRQRIAAGVTSVPGAPAEIFGIADPDVDTIHVIVEARSLAHDAGGHPRLDGPFRGLYELERPFPAAPVDPLADSPPLSIRLDYVDVAKAPSLEAPASGLDLPIPTARDVRIRLTGVCRGAPPGHFGSDAARTGITVDFTTRRESNSEEGLLVPFGAKGVEAFYFQPGSDVAARLAQQLDLDVNGLSFSGRPGSRTVISASRFLRNTLSGDHSVLTLATAEELLHQWIIAIRFDLARDWTWDGLDDVGIAVVRDDVGPDPIGTIELRRTAPDSALAEGDESQRRALTHLVFFDAVNPQPPAGAFPSELHVRYHLRPTLTGAAPVTVVDLEALRLPVTVPPAQVPRLASAGIALSPYVAAADYSSTEPRTRALWLEFDEPIADDADCLFARVLAYAPDPLLAPFSTLPDVADEPPLSLPDEAVRVIAPGQSRDDAGLAAMTPLTRSTGSKRHFVLPLPLGVGPESLLLFGLWTYELRVGHANLWSTAQGRFGRPLRIAGVQHPAPTLVCTAGRVIGTPSGQDGIVATAPYATPINLDGSRMPFPGREFRVPTRMYFLLYAQAQQADGAAWRNILLFTRESIDDDAVGEGPSTRDALALTFFTDAEVESALAGIFLPANSPLSVLAVELMPNGTDPPTGPLTGQIGSARILRTSPLSPVHAVCPPSSAPLPKRPAHPGLPVVIENRPHALAGTPHSAAGNGSTHSKSHRPKTRPPGAHST
jgi:hypothetical protein